MDSLVCLRREKPLPVLLWFLGGWCEFHPVPVWVNDDDGAVPPAGCVSRKKACFCQPLHARDRVGGLEPDANATRGMSRGYTGINLEHRATWKAGGVVTRPLPVAFLHEIQPKEAVEGACAIDVRATDHEQGEARGGEWGWQPCEMSHEVRGGSLPGQGMGASRDTAPQGTRQSCPRGGVGARSGTEPPCHRIRSELAVVGYPRREEFIGLLGGEVPEFVREQVLEDMQHQPLGVGWDGRILPRVHEVRRDHPHPPWVDVNRRRGHVARGGFLEIMAHNQPNGRHLPAVGQQGVEPGQAKSQPGVHGLVVGLNQCVFAPVDRMLSVLAARRGNTLSRAGAGAHDIERKMVAVRGLDPDIELDAEGIQVPLERADREILAVLQAGHRRLADPHRCRHVLLGVTEQQPQLLKRDGGGRGGEGAVLEELDDPCRGLGLARVGLLWPFSIPVAEHAGADAVPPPGGPLDGDQVLVHLEIKPPGPFRVARASEPGLGGRNRLDDACLQ